MPEILQTLFFRTRCTWEMIVNLLQVHAAAAGLCSGWGSECWHELAGRLGVCRVRQQREILVQSRCLGDQRRRIQGTLFGVRQWRPRTVTATQHWQWRPHWWRPTWWNLSTMLNELNCTIGISFSCFHCCGRHGHGLWPPLFVTRFRIFWRRWGYLPNLRNVFTGKCRVKFGHFVNFPCIYFPATNVLPPMPPRVDWAMPVLETIWMNFPGTFVMANWILCKGIRKSIRFWGSGICIYQINWVNSCNGFVLGPDLWRISNGTLENLDCLSIFTPRALRS